MDSEKPPARRSRLLTGCTVLVALPVLYLAAFGPFCYLYARAGIEDERPLAVYFPLRSLADGSPTTRRWFFAYANWGFALGERHRQKVDEKRSAQP